jgi:hypothetical protein
MPPAPTPKRHAFAHEDLHACRGARVDEIATPDPALPGGSERISQLAATGEGGRSGVVRHVTAPDDPECNAGMMSADPPWR